jgi:biotin operon repressor
MCYERSQNIEIRLQQVLELVKRGNSSTPMIAAELGVSVPTVSRCIEALRTRGHEIRSEKRGTHWCYLLARSPNRQTADSNRAS